MRTTIQWATLAISLGLPALPGVTFESLLQEMSDRDALARFPDPPYECRQASSYNRLSTARDQANQGTGGWFADSDGTGFIRTEMINGQQEWVMMEHTGAGALTRFWTPFFHYSFSNRTGPNIRIYLDGSTTPVIDENFIELLSNLDWSVAEYGSKPVPQNSISLPAPFAGFTARAGVLHLPIPFASSCKVTMTAKPFYNTISYRTYPPGTEVQTFTIADLSSPSLATVGTELTAPTAFAGGCLSQSSESVPAGGEVSLALPAGSAAVRHLEIDLDASAVQADPAILRSLVLSATFDGEETIWCPVGDFFCSPDRLNDLPTWTRETIAADGGFVCRWVMPYQTSASVRLLNLGASPVAADLTVRTGTWTWDSNSMHFHANWRADDVVPGTPFLDWNFIDVQGRGVLVGDAWTVLNLTTGWWGEGDEKIYVDDEYELAKFPSQFGTGTEDYYGWAGGVNPTRNDVFANPYEANAQVGSTASNSSQGFNVNTRTRALDAIPFGQRLVFDMEASAGTGQRNAWDLLMYSSVVYWYGRPGATSNRPPLPAEASQPITSFEEMQAQSDLIRNGGPGAIPGLQIKTDFDFSDNSYQTVFATTPYGAGPTGGGTGALSFDGTTALQASTVTVFGGTAPADNYGYEVIITPSALNAFDIMAAVVDGGGSNSSNFLFQQSGAYRIIESGEGAVAGTTAPVIGTKVALAFVMEGGTGRLFVNGAEEASRSFSAGGGTPIGTASLEAVILGGNLFDAATGAFNGTIDRFRAFTFDPGQFAADQLLDPGG